MRTHTPEASARPGAGAAQRRRNPYLAVLSYPGALKFSLSGAVARLPMSMVGISIVLMIQGLYGSYGLGGRISAAYILTQAACSPQIARLVDRHGQARIMRPLLAVNALAMIALVAAAVTRAPEAVLWVLAILIGATIGSVGALVRARWNALVTTPRELHTAYSLESVFDEMIFAVGPVIATAAATSIHPAAGLVVPALAVLIGGTWFLSNRATEPAPTPAPPRGEGGGLVGVLRSRAMLALIAVFVGVGAVFGSIDVAVLAFAREAGSPGSAGLVLASFALGSMIAGFGYGLKQWRSRPTTRLLITVTLLLVGAVALPFADTLAHAALVVFVAGFAVAPTIITGNQIVQLVVASGQLTEGLAWVSTAMGVGVSLGSSFAGSQIDASGSHAGFLVGTAGAALAFVLAIVLWAAVTVRQRNAARSVAS